MRSVPNPRQTCGRRSDSRQFNVFCRELPAKGEIPVRQSRQGTRWLYNRNAVFTSPVGVTAYLMTAFGPGTTSADQVASSLFSITGPASGSELLFSALSLAAGTYYLVIASNPGGEIGWNASATPVVTTAGGVMLNPGFACFNVSAVDYPPSSGSCQPAGGMLFDVSATPAPEPPTAFVLGLAAVGGIYLRKKVARTASLRAARTCSSGK